MTAPPVAGLAAVVAIIAVVAVALVGPLSFVAGATIFNVAATHRVREALIRQGLDPDDARKGARLLLGGKPIPSTPRFAK